MDANTNVQMALENFRKRNGVYPNRIIMGYYLVKELTRDIYNSNISEINSYHFSKAEIIKYKGIPVEIDYCRPNALSVGYMEDWFETNES